MGQWWMTIEYYELFSLSTEDWRKVVYTTR